MEYVKLGFGILAIIIGFILMSRGRGGKLSRTGFWSIIGGFVIVANAIYNLSAVW